MSRCCRKKAITFVYSIVIALQSIEQRPKAKKAVDIREEKSFVMSKPKVFRWSK